MHSGPDVVPRQRTIIDVARDAAAVGMRALAIKDDNTIIADRAALARTVLDDTVLILGAIVLNHAVADFNAEAVQKCTHARCRNRVHAKYGCCLNHRKRSRARTHAVAIAFRYASRPAGGATCIWTMPVTRALPSSRRAGLCAR